MQPFDAVLLIAFGGPQGRDDIRPFLANVLRGRRVAPERVEEVAHHYELFDGVSPLTELTRRQASGIERALAARGTPLPVYVGMRNWHPYLADTLAQMSRDGVRRAVGVIASAHRSYSGCLQYRENVRDARGVLREAGLADVQVTYVGDWHLSDGFVAANAANIRAALDSLPAGAREGAEIVFTAHSIPVSMAERYPYERQIRESAEAVIVRLTPDDGASGFGTSGFGPSSVASAFRRKDASRRKDTFRRKSAIVYQSRSGRPEDPWLGPDVCDYIRDAAARGVPGLVLCPIGFICDHVEVLYDLDVEAMEAAREAGIPLARASSVNDHPRFIEALADAVTATLERYAGGRPQLLLHL